MNSITLNIGLAVGTAGTENSLGHTLQALERVGFTIDVVKVVRSDTERTAVVQCPCPFAVDDLGVASAISRLSVTLGQDCIAAHDGVQGALHGPQAAAWGDFNPEFFFGIDGRRMAPVSLPLAA